MLASIKYPQPLYQPCRLMGVFELMRLFSDQKDLSVLQSAAPLHGQGRYSFICFDAFASFFSKGKTYYWNHTAMDIDDPFDFIDEQIKQYKIQKIQALPPLQGGVVGYFGYEASHYLEVLPQVVDNIQLPDIYLNFYANVIAIDHQLNQSWIIATGFPETLEDKRLKQAHKDLQAIHTILESGQKGSMERAYLKPWVKNNPITSNFTRASYIHAVNRTKEYILNGDIFEANISQQFRTLLDNHRSALDLYFKLITTNPAPFSGLITMADGGYIISTSPERFIKLSNGSVETCPIKGTRKRSKNHHEDKRLANELYTSEKDRAENIMIVDLMRNDVSRVCQPHTVMVAELCALKSFETVHHLVSKVTGILKKDVSAIDVLKATFPPGSVTGAPKIRAIEIISELEQQARGPYCGCLGYMSFTGDMDTSVIIRTYFLHKNKLFFSAGGAIVLDSVPDEEYQESLTKAQALMNALTS